MKGLKIQDYKFIIFMNDQNHKYKVEQYKY